MIALAAAVRNARLQAIVTALDAGGAAASLILYTGPQPDPGADLTDQVALATLTFNRPAGSVANGVLTFAGLAEVQAKEEGTAAWVRAAASDASIVFDADVGAKDSGSTIEISNTTLYPGALVQATKAQLIEP